MLIKNKDVIKRIKKDLKKLSDREVIKLLLEYQTKRLIKQIDEVAYNDKQ